MGLVDFLRDARARGIRPRPPYGHVERLPPDDDPDEGSPEESNGTDPISVTIDYVDSKGETSLRTITIHAVERNAAGHYCLKAECHAREAPRTFRLDRITDIIDVDGEVHTDVEDFLRSVLGDETFDQAPDAAFSGSRRQQDVSPPRHAQPATAKERRAALRQRSRPFTRVLVAVARADGRLSDGEDTPIVAFLISHMAPEGFDDSDRRWLEGYVKRMNPPPDVVEQAMKDVAEALKRARHSGDPDGLLAGYVQAIGAVIKADGQIDQREVAILRELTELAA